ATWQRAERSSVPSSWRMSAFSASTRQTARRTDTTLSGSYVALRTSALCIGRNLRACVAAGSGFRRLVSRQRVERSAPAEVAEQVLPHARTRRGSGGPVLGLEPEAQVARGRHGEERRTRPPARRGETPRRAQCAAPGPGAGPDGPHGSPHGGRPAPVHL